MSATFQVRQMNLTKELVDNTENPYETALAIARVNDSMEARSISYEDKDALLEVCEEIVHELALEVNANDIFTIMIDAQAMETYLATEFMDLKRRAS